MLYGEQVGPTIMPESPQMPEFLQFCFRVPTSISDELTLFRELNSFL